MQDYEYVAVMIYDTLVIPAAVAAGTGGGEGGQRGTFARATLCRGWYSEGQKYGIQKLYTPNLA